MKYLFTIFFALIPAVAPVIMTGCQPASPTQEKNSTPDAQATHDHHGHDHHHDHGDGEHPETYAEAVQQLEKLHNIIRDAFTSDNKDAAHDPLHQIGHLLEDIGELAEKASLGKEQLTAVKKAKEDLFDAYTQIDSVFHEKKEIKYEDLEKKIDSALAVLQNAVKKEAKPDESPEKAHQTSSKETPQETSKPISQQKPQTTPEEKPKGK